jgi:hypothetical protein
MSESLFAVYGIGRAYMDICERLRPLLIRIARKHTEQHESLSGRECGRRSPRGLDDANGKTAISVVYDRTGRTPRKNCH